MLWKWYGKCCRLFKMPSCGRRGAGLAGSLLMVSCLASQARAGQLLYTPVAQADNEGRQVIRLNISSIDQLAGMNSLSIVLPSGRTVAGTVEDIIDGPGLLSEPDQQGVTTGIVVLSDRSGGIELTEKAGRITGLLLRDAVNGRFYKALFDQNLQGTLQEEDPDDYICVRYPKPEGDQVAQDVPPVTGDIPPLSELQNLQSRPGATNVLYINYWGGVLSGTAWNEEVGDIEYTPFSADSDTSSFSDTDRYIMWLGWQEAAEDYAPFDINVTTSQAVYDATPVVNRVQMIATTTHDIYPGAGGVAYVGVFHLPSDYWKTGWAWNNSAGNLGMTISHETGHMVGLDHDGTSSFGYYGGHGDWGPIMGAPFTKPYVQWSRGEYPDANNQEDDLAILLNVLGGLPDDAGDDIATASPISQTLTSFNGLVAPDGVYADADVYRVTTTGALRVTVSPLLGHDGETRGANLAMNVTLTDQVGNIIAEMHSDDNTPLAPATNIFSFSSYFLPPGDYYLYLDAVSPDPDWSTGFGEYGNGGMYRIDLCTEPLPTTVLPANTWRQLSLPADPGNSNTVAGIFADDIQGVYGQVWIVYRFDADAGSYVQAGLHDVLNQGEGFWILQNSGADVVLDMPETSVVTPIVSQIGCVAEQGCFAVPLPVQAGSVRWAMGGYPFAASGPVGGIRVVTGSTGDCQSSNGGCTLAEGDERQVVSRILWRYVDENSGYHAITTDDFLDPWSGFWIATLPDAVPGQTEMIIPVDNCQGLAGSPGE